jgi:pimeloyl-ACP methyl ester carboxylesterase
MRFDAATGQYEREGDPRQRHHLSGRVVATFGLIHGGGGSAWDWHLVAAELRDRGHHPVAVDLPCEEPSAGWWDYVDAVVEAIGERRELVVVGHSLGGFTAPLVCARMPVDLLVLVAAMIPSPGELFDDWWASSGYEASGYDDVFYHDVPPDLADSGELRGPHSSARTPAASRRARPNFERTPASPGPEAIGVRGERTVRPASSKPGCRAARADPLSGAW